MISNDQIIQRLYGHQDLLHWLCLKCGIKLGDSIPTNQIPVILAELRRQRKQLVQIMDKGGVVIVVDGETLITTYKRNSFRRF